MNEEFINDMFKVATNNGFSGDIEKFKNLLSTNRDFNNDMLSVARDNGYKNTDEKFSELSGNDFFFQQTQQKEDTPQEVSDQSLVSTPSATSLGSEDIQQPEAVQASPQETVGSQGESPWQTSPSIGGAFTLQDIDFDEAEKNALLKTSGSYNDLLKREEDSGVEYGVEGFSQAQGAKTATREEIFKNEYAENLKQSIVEQVPEELRGEGFEQQLKEQGLSLDITGEGKIGNKTIMESAGNAVKKGSTDLIFTLGWLANQNNPSMASAMDIKRKELGFDYSKKINEYEKNFTQSLGSGDFENASGVLLNTLGESAPVMAAAATTGGLGTLGSLGTLSAITGAQEYLNVKDEKWFNEMSNLGQVGYITAMGGFEGFGEMMGGRVLNRIGKDIIKQGLKGNSKKSLTEFVKGAAKQYGKNIGEEGLGESVTAAGQYLADKIAKGEEIDIAELLNQTFEGGAIGAAMGGGMTTGGNIAKSAYGMASKSKPVIAAKEKVARLMEEAKYSSNEVEQDATTKAAAKAVEEKQIVFEAEKAKAEAMSEEDRTTIADKDAQIDAKQAELESLSGKPETAKYVQEELATLQTEISEIEAKYAKKQEGDNSLSEEADRVLAEEGLGDTVEEGGQELGLDEGAIKDPRVERIEELENAPFADIKKERSGFFGKIADMVFGKETDEDASDKADDENDNERWKLASEIKEEFASSKEGKSLREAVFDALDHLEKDPEAKDLWDRFATEEGLTEDEESRRQELNKDYYAAEKAYTEAAFKAANDTYAKSQSVQKKKPFTKTEQGKKVNSLFGKPVAKVKEIASKFKAAVGIKTESGSNITEIDVDNSKAIADAYDAMKHEPNNPEVREAYEAMAKETIEQYRAITDGGVEFEIYEGKGEPYKSSKEMLEDLEKGHLYILSTEADFGQEKITDNQRKENPLLRDSGLKDKNGKPLLVNDIFRGVHDFFGHGERGNSFGAKGEENAWDVHSRMYSPKARRAMTTETRGQNSWVNFGKQMRNEDGSIKKKGEDGYLSPTERPFAEQKLGLLPVEFSENNYETKTEKTSDTKKSTEDSAPKSQSKPKNAKTAPAKTEEQKGKKKEKESDVIEGSDIVALKEAAQKGDARQKSVIQAVINAINATIKLLPSNFQLYVAKDNKAFAKAAEKSEAYVKKSGYDGFFDPETNSVYINLEQATPKKVVHEIVHAILFNTFYKGGTSKTAAVAKARAASSVMVKSIHKVLKESKEGSQLEVVENIERALENAVERGDYDADEVNEEVVSVLSEFMVSEDGFAKLETTTKHKIIAAINNFLKAIGLDKFVMKKTATDQDVISFFNTIPQMIAKGESIDAEQVESLENLSNSVDGAQGSAAYGGNKKSITLKSIKESIVSSVNTNFDYKHKGYGKNITLPPKEEMASVLKKSGGAAIFINSDGTKVGVRHNGESLDGGWQYTYIDKNTKDNIGFAATSSVHVKTNHKLMTEIAAQRDKQSPKHKGKPVAVFVTIQHEKTMLGEWYAGEFFMEGIDKALSNGVYENGIEGFKADFTEAIHKAHPKRSKSDVEKLKGDKLKDYKTEQRQADNLIKLVGSNKFKTHKGRIDISKIFASKEFTFGFRVNLLKQVMAKGKVSEVTSNPRIKQALLDVDMTLKEFYAEHMDEALLEMLEASNFKENTIGGVTMGGYYADPYQSLESFYDNRVNGINHAQFNESFSSNGKTFRLDNAHNVNSLNPTMGYPSDAGYAEYNKVNKTNLKKRSGVKSETTLEQQQEVAKFLFNNYKATAKNGNTVIGVPSVDKNGKQRIQSYLALPFTSIGGSMYTATQSETTSPKKKSVALPFEIEPAITEDGEVDYEAYDELKAIAEKRDLGITSDREINNVVRDSKGDIIGGSFTAYDNGSGEYTFDVVVDERFEGKGIGSKILDSVKDLPYEIQEMNPEAKIKVDVVNPSMQEMLSNRGFEVVERVGKDRVIMSPSPKKKSINLAPNGKPSNLNEEQHKAVRTPAFKKWFGDWENDPKNASKFVDENGEPQVLFHGSASDFDVFDKKKLGSLTNTAVSKLGFFFASKKSGADQYAFIGGLQNPYLENKLTEARPFFVNSRKPYIASKEEWADLLNWASDGSRKHNTPTKLKKANKEFKQMLIDKGYDGVDFADRLEVMALEPNQIKLADGSNKTFDPKENSIKKSVNLTYESSEKLKKIGTLKEYSEYLETVFPNSKVKDVVYHGGNEGIETFDKNLLGETTKAESANYGFFFSSNPEVSNTYIKQWRYTYIGEFGKLQDEWNQKYKEIQGKRKANEAKRQEIRNEAKTFIGKIKELLNKLFTEGYITSKEQLKRLREESDKLYDQLSEMTGLGGSPNITSFIDATGKDIFDNMSSEWTLKKGKKLYSALVNAEKPLVKDYKNKEKDQKFYSDNVKEAYGSKSKGTDSVVLKNVLDPFKVLPTMGREQLLAGRKKIEEVYTGDDIVVFNNEQIHILDSKKDIQGFKDWKSTPKKKKSINLAPNGKPSNLNEEQHKAVRTPAFKKWFGDWENDPKNASKVLDENGEPLVVYHGSNAVDIEQFDRDESGRVNSGVREYGTFFSTRPELANLYANVTQRTDDYQEKIDKKIHRLESLQVTVRNNRDFDAIQQELEILRRRGRVYPVFLNIRDMKTFNAKGESNIEAWNNLEVNLGYKLANGRPALEALAGQNSARPNAAVDGVKAENIIDMSTSEDKDSYMYKRAERDFKGDAYLVFDKTENAVKLADGSNTTFDPKENSIKKSINLNVSPETSENYSNLTEDGKGNFVFYHVSEKPRREIKKSSGGKNTPAQESAALGKIGGVAMYYTSPTDGENQVQGASKQIVKVPQEKVYDFNADKEGFYDEAKKRHKKEHPNKAFDPNTQAAYITQIANENGYDMIVIDWGGKSRAQTTVSMQPSDTQITKGNKITKSFNEENKSLESNRAKGWTPVKKVTKQERIDKVYGKIAKEIGVDNYSHPLYKLEKMSYYSLGDRFAPFKTQEEITEAIENSDLPKALKTEYKETLESKDKAGKSEQKLDKKKSVAIDTKEAFNESNNMFYEQEDKLFTKSVENARKKAWYTKKAWTDRQSNIRKALLDANARFAEALMTAKAGARAFADRTFIAVEKLIYDGMTLEQEKLFDQLLFHERIVQIDKNRDAAKRKRPSHPRGFNLERSQAALEGMREEIGIEEYEMLQEAADKYFAAFNDILKTMHKEGLINNETYDRFKEDKYIPRMFLSHLFGSGSNINTMESNGLRKNQIAAIDEGSEGLALMDSRILLNGAYRSLSNKVFTNKANAAAAEVVKNQNGTHFGKPANYERWNRDGVKHKKGELKTDKYGNFAIKEADKGYVNITFFRNGARDAFQMPSDIAAEWLDIENNTSGEFDNFFRKILLTGILKKAATGQNPAFFLSNIPMDYMNVLMFTDIYDSEKFGLAGASIKLGASFAKMAAKVAKVKSTGNYDSEAGKLFLEFSEHGGMMEFLTTYGKPDEIAKRDAAKRNAKSFKAWGKGKKAVVNSLAFTGEVSEIAMRLAVYEKMKAKLTEEHQGAMTNQDAERIRYMAAAKSRKIMDFAQGGLFTKKMDMFVPYFNAAMQGFRIAGSYAAENPKMFTAKLAQLAVPVAALMMYTMAVMDDDEYEDIPMYMKNNYFIIPFPFKTKNDKGEDTRGYLRVRKLPQIAPFTNAIEYGTRKALNAASGESWGDKHEDSITTDRMFSALQDASPVPLPMPFAMDKAVSMMPPLVQGMTTYATDYDNFRKQELTPDDEKGISDEYKGSRDKNIALWAKKAGMLTGESPRKIQGAAEKIITTPSTNAAVGMMYSLADNMINMATEIPENQQSKYIGGKGMFDGLKGKVYKEINPSQSEWNNKEKEEIKAIAKTDRWIGRKDIAFEVKKDDFNPDNIKTLGEKYGKDLGSEVKYFANYAKSVYKYKKQFPNRDSEFYALIDIEFTKEPAAKARLFGHHFGYPALKSPEFKDAYSKFIKSTGGSLNSADFEHYREMQEEAENAWKAKGK